MLHEESKLPNPVSLHVVMPSEARPYFIIVTSGMSNRPMNVPAGMDESARAECFLCLPADWPLSMINRGWREAEFAWPFFLLQECARFPFEHDTWLGYGHSVPIPHALDLAGRFTGVSMLQPLLMPEDFIAIEAGDDEVIWLLPVFPCTPEEMILKRLRGYAALSEKFVSMGVTELLDPLRPSVASTQ
ncbi:Ankyrin repeats containing protein [Granulicella sibirica]|uniref:Ankyrin repeats containing protein n=1 Tax=Granulicella sibirica TaxID=2479048 RepID=A0A4Q0T7Q3_9BACT|nr:Ankyrin repeats containing protein [Granulicella sibirica]